MSVPTSIVDIPTRSEAYRGRNVRTIENPMKAKIAERKRNCAERLRSVELRPCIMFFDLPANWRLDGNDNNTKKIKRTLSAEEA
jgi:hypothetical protein